MTKQRRHWRWCGWWFDAQGGWFRVFLWQLVVLGPQMPRLFSEREGYVRYLSLGRGWRVRVERSHAWETSR